MDQYERAKLAEAMIESSYKQNDFVLKEGEAGNVFYIVLEGEAVATNKEGLSLKSYKAGDYFGEIALLKNMPRAANVSAKSTELRVLGLERSCFKRLLGPLEDILKRNMDNYLTML